MRVPIPSPVRCERPSSRRGPGLLGNSVYNLIGQGLVVALGFAAIRVIFRRLGADAVGIVYFTLALNGTLASALDMGLSSTTVREAASNSSPDAPALSEYIRTASAFYWTAYLVVAVGIYAAAPLLVTRWLNLSTLSSSLATSAVRTLGVSGLLVLPKSLYLSLIRGRARMDVSNGIDVCSTGLQQIGSILVIVSGGGLQAVALLQGVCYALAVLAYFIASAHFFTIAALIPFPKLSVIQRTYAYTSRAACISFFATIHSQADKIIGGKVLSVAMLGTYTVVWGAVSRLTMLTNAISQAAFPSLTAAWSEGNSKQLLAEYWRLQDLMCLLLLPVFAAVPFAVIPLFSVLLNPALAYAALLPATLLSLGFYMNGALNTPYIFSLAVGKPGIAARQNAYAAAIVLPITAWLIYRYKITGAGMSWVVYHIFAYMYAVPRTCRQIIGIPVRQWFAHFLRILVTGTAIYGSVWLAVKLTGHLSIVWLVGAYLVATALYLVAASGLATDGLRSACRRKIEDLSGRLRRPMATPSSS